MYVIHAADGNIPSDMATGSDEEIEDLLAEFADDVAGQYGDI